LSAAIVPSDVVVLLVDFLLLVILEFRPRSKYFVLRNQLIVIFLVPSFLEFLPLSLFFEQVVVKFVLMH
jgi:hypothetical protein